MTTSATTELASEFCLDAAIEAAIKIIAPSWPLDRMIAVNPYWGYVDRPFSEAANAQATIAGSPLTLDASWYRQHWQKGTITESALQQARDEANSPLTTEQLVHALGNDEPPPVPAPLLADSLDARRDLRHQPAWCDTITHQISQFCAAYFDRDQSDWRPDQSGNLYTSWRSGLCRDHSVALLMKAPGIPAKAASLAQDARQQIKSALTQLSVAQSDILGYLQAVLMRVSGWAAWCAYLRWQARLAGHDDETIVDLLAIRLSWECLVDDGKRHHGSVWERWQSAWRDHFRAAPDWLVPPLSIWQRAEEISYQRTLIAKLVTAPMASATQAPRVQAAFCIDVRSEVLRRHLEAQSPEIQTLGFAGFFGLPISYRPLGTDATRPQLPGLLAPAMAITDSTGNTASDDNIARRRDTKLRSKMAWRTFQSLPLSAFALVESVGLGYMTTLLRRTLPGRNAQTCDTHLGLNAADATALRPTLDAQAAGGLDEQAAIATQVLTAMGLTDHLARLVLLVGHASQTQNNPHRAGLDCGACCGQRGDINARALAGLLNDPKIRARVREAGVNIPDSTHFVAGQHNTTTDEVALFDLNHAPDSHRGDLETIQNQLASAQLAALSERAPALGLQDLCDRPTALLQAIQTRANDWAQPRPEWGLANNAALLVAPRSLSRGVNLEGRCFLHDYDYRSDPEGTLLEQIITAPMVVAHWINMQYFASTVDNQRYGSGNKTLHNVVGGRLGVFEGNGGDLRIGLPLQSVHNGEQWQHTPLRLTVVIEAPRSAINAVLDKHETVRHLVDKQWLHLVRLEDRQTEVYRQGSWQPAPVD